MAGATGRPVARSQTMVVSRWLVMPTAAICEARHARAIQQQPRRIKLSIPDLVGILLHPSRLRIAAVERRGLHGDVAPLFVVERGARAGGALVEG